MGEKKSIVELCGASPSACGYCTGNSSSLSYGVISNSMKAEDYESLMLIGWRRSGTYFYKPVMYATCCPAYTIRLEASLFTISKKQRQVVRRIDRFLECDSVLQADHSSKIEADAAADNTSNFAATKALMTGNGKAQDSKSSTPAHTLTYETTPAEYTDERYELYRKYQIAVHGDDPKSITPLKFKNFLIQSPLFDSSTVKSTKSTTLKKSDANMSSKKEAQISEKGAAFPGSETAKERNSAPRSYSLGTYHQLHRLDGRLVAVGVVDILPSGLSSVYLFYDPDEKILSLGKYTAIKEIEFCMENNLKYYYMGFYIHSCKKMRYKGEYEPSQLMCPSALDWHAYKDCVELLDKHKFTPLNRTLLDQFNQIQKQRELQKLEKQREKKKEKVIVEKNTDEDKTSSQITNTLVSNTHIKENQNGLESNNNIEMADNNDNKTDEKAEDDSNNDDVDDDDVEEPDLVDEMKNSFLAVFRPNFNFLTSSLSSSSSSSASSLFSSADTDNASDAPSTTSASASVTSVASSIYGKRNSENDTCKNSEMREEKEKRKQREEVYSIPLLVGKGERNES